jgi:hypothetical protein
LATSTAWAAALLGGGGGTGTPLMLRCHPLGRWQTDGAGTPESAKARAVTALMYGRRYPPRLPLWLPIRGTAFGRRRQWQRLRRQWMTEVAARSVRQGLMSLVGVSGGVLGILNKVDRCPDGP